MSDSSSSTRRYAVAVVLGGVAGGLAVALATRAVPKMMSRMMSEMMRYMMAQMEEARCDPMEMWRRMMAGFGEVQERHE